MSGRPSFEEREAQRQADEQAFAARLAEVQLDGPFRFPEGGMFGSTLFGGVRDRFAVCLRCGALVVLNDPEERPEGGAAVERGVRLHTAWHAAMDER